MLQLLKLGINHLSNKNIVKKDEAKVHCTLASSLMLLSIVPFVANGTCF